MFASNGRLYQSTWGLGTADPVSAVLMHDNVLNEYVLDTITNSGSDWVVTMPTKRFYVPVAAKATPAFNNPFQRNFTPTGSCDDVSLNIFDREENTTSTPLELLAAASYVEQFDLLGSERDHVQQLERAGLDQQRQHPDRLPGRLARPRLYAQRLGDRGAQHELVNDAGHDDHPAGRYGDDGQHASPTTAYRWWASRSSSFTNGAITVNGAAVLSNYGGNFIHKYTTDVHL